MIVFTWSLFVPFIFLLECDYILGKACLIVKIHVRFARTRRPPRQLNSDGATWLRHLALLCLTPLTRAQRALLPKGPGGTWDPTRGGGQGSQGGVRFARPSRRARCSLCSHRFADLNSAGVLSHLCDGLVARALCGFGFPCKLCGFVRICADLRGLMRF